MYAGGYILLSIFLAGNPEPPAAIATRRRDGIPPPHPGSGSASDRLQPQRNGKRRRHRAKQPDGLSGQSHVRKNIIIHDVMCTSS